MILGAIEVLGECWLDRAADHLIAALVGGPVRAVVAGALLLWAIGHWLGWWAVAAITAAAIADTAWAVARLLRGGRRR